jgi:replication factor A1
MKIADLKPGMRKVNLAVKVLEISEPRQVTTRTGESSTVATALVQDDSGIVKLSLWNDDIAKVSVNSQIRIENGYVTSFRGETQLNVGRYGKLTVLE